MSQIPIEKQVFDKNAFGKVINTQFSQLLNNVASSSAAAQQLPQLETALQAAGTSIADVLNIGVALGLYSPNLKFFERLKSQPYI